MSKSDGPIAQWAYGYHKAQLDAGAPMLRPEEQLLLAEAAEVRPGDTLIVRYNARQLTAHDAARIKDQLEIRLPGVEVVVVNADGLAVYRPTAQLTTPKDPGD